MAKSVQFRDKEQVMEAYNSADVKAWSVWNDKQFLTKGIGADMLQAFIEILEQGGTKAIYTVKVYEDITDRKQIKENTMCDGSFNFMLIDDPFEIAGARYERSPFLSGINQRLKAIEDDRKAEPIDHEPETLGSIALGLLKNPSDLAILVEVGKSLLGLPSNPMAVARMNGLGTNTTGAATAEATETDYSPDQVARLQKAMDTLGQCDAKIVDHMEKLAKIAKEHPAQFKMLLFTLEGM